MNSRKILCLLLAAAAGLSFYACTKLGPVGSASDGDTPDYSQGLTELGYYDGVTASDYVTLPDAYCPMPVPAGYFEVSDADLQSQIDSLLNYFPETTQITDRAIADGDKVNIDFVGTIDGVAFDGGSTNGAGTQVTAGSTQLIDDFLTQIIGAKPGDQLNIEVTFPEPYEQNPDLAGKDAVFATTINYIYGETVIPELTDDFVAGNLSAYFGCATVDELKTMLSDQIKSTQVRNYVLDTLFKGCEYKDIPQKLIDSQMDIVRKEVALSAAAEETDTSTWLANNGFDSLDAYCASREESVTNMIHQYLAIQAMAEELNIAVEEGDLGAYFMQIVGTSDYSQYVEHYGQGFVYQAVLAEKVCDYVVAQAVSE